MITRDHGATRHHGRKGNSGIIVETGCQPGMAITLLCKLTTSKWFRLNYDLCVFPIINLNALLLFFPFIKAEFVLSFCFFVECFFVCFSEHHSCDLGHCQFLPMLSERLKK